MKKILRLSAIFFLTIACSNNSQSNNKKTHGMDGTVENYINKMAKELREYNESSLQKSGNTYILTIIEARRKSFSICITQQDTVLKLSVSKICNSGSVLEKSIPDIDRKLNIELLKQRIQALKQDSLENIDFANYADPTIFLIDISKDGVRKTIIRVTERDFPDESKGSFTQLLNMFIEPLPSEVLRLKCP